jgi:hypothetical protein
MLLLLLLLLLLSLLLLLLPPGSCACAGSAGHWSSADSQLLHTVHHLHGENEVVCVP